MKRTCTHAHKKKNTKKGPPRGVSIFFLTQILFFCDLEPHAKFRNPMITPSGRKVFGRENKKIITNIVDTSFRSDQNINKYSGHFVPQQFIRAAHALRSDQFIYMVMTSTHKKLTFVSKCSSAQRIKYSNIQVFKCPRVPY
jgi:hypothetical protein